MIDISMDIDKCPLVIKQIDKSYYITIIIIILLYMICFVVFRINM